MRAPVRGVAVNRSTRSALASSAPTVRIDLSEGETDLWHVLERTAPISRHAASGACVRATAGDRR